MNHMEAQAAWRAHAARRSESGLYFPEAVSYLPPEFKRDLQLAMDAQPQLATTPNAGIPSWLTTWIDPAVFEVLFAPVKGADILGEVRKGSWVDQTAMFPTVEHDGEVSSYGDFAKNGHVSVNTTFPQRQSYLFQTFKEYGELETERTGLARIGLVAEIDKSAATIMMRYLNYTYFFGVANLQNYGLTNDPNLTAYLTPGVKANGNGNVWIYNGAINASANEVYADIQSAFLALVNQTNGLIDEDTKLVLALSPASAVALTATNSFNVNVADLLKKNFPNIRIERAVQYGAVTSSNPQGIAGGNVFQLIAEETEGQQTGYCAFNEKSRAHPIIRKESSFRQKMTAGSWGAIIRQPANIAQMIGI